MAHLGELAAVLFDGQWHRADGSTRKTRHRFLTTLHNVVTHHDYLARFAYAHQHCSTVRLSKVSDRRKETVYLQVVQQRFDKSAAGAIVPPS